MADIRHTFVSPKSDGPDATLIRPSNWNDAHSIVSLVQADVTGLRTTDYPTFRGVIDSPSTVSLTSGGVPIPLTNEVCAVSTTGAAIGTIANGTVGQKLFIYCTSVSASTDTLTLTPAVMLGGTSVRFVGNPLGQGASFIYTASGWVHLGMTSLFNDTSTSPTPATTGTMTVVMDTRFKTITPTGACTFNASGGKQGQLCTFVITTSGTTARTLTWGTNFIKQGTLSTGTVNARYFMVTFACINGTLWVETGRTPVLS